MGKVAALRSMKHEQAALQTMSVPAAQAQQQQLPAVQLRWHLRLDCQHAPDLEKQFWSSARAMRALQVSDMLAGVCSIIHIVLGMQRMTAPGGKSVFSHRLEIRGLSINLFLVSTLFFIMGLLPLLLLLRWPGVYNAWHTQLRIGNRIMRAIVNSIQQLSPSAAQRVAQGVALRTMSELQLRPGRSLLSTVVHPVAYYAQQSQYLLPFRWAVILQAINYALSVVWSARMPCVVFPLQTRPGESSVFYASLAAEACEFVRSCVAFLGGMLADLPTSLFESAELCQGDSAVQLLQTFASIMLLLVLPLTVIYWTEYTLKCNFLNSCNVTYVGPLSFGRCRQANVNDSHLSSNAAASHSFQQSEVHIMQIASASRAEASSFIWWSVCTAAALSLLLLPWSAAELLTWMAHEPCS